MRPIQPTVQSINSHYQNFYKNNSEFQLNYKSIQNLVRLYPSHRKHEDVLIKSVVINKLYSTNVMNIRALSKHIISLDIRKHIQKGDPGIVKAIAEGHNIISSKTEKEISFYSFATKYCFSHNNLNYPIFDRYVQRMLLLYNKNDGFSKFKKSELKDYPTYLSILNEFRKYYGLKKVSINKLDKFLWRQGAKYYGMI